MGLNTVLGQAIGDDPDSVFNLLSSAALMSENVVVIWVASLLPFVLPLEILLY